MALWGKGPKNPEDGRRVLKMEDIVRYGLARDVNASVFLPDPSLAKVGALKLQHGISNQTGGGIECVFPPALRISEPYFQIHCQPPQ